MPTVIESRIAPACPYTRSILPFPSFTLPYTPHRPPSTTPPTPTHPPHTESPTPTEFILSEPLPTSTCISSPTANPDPHTQTHALLAPSGVSNSFHKSFESIFASLLNLNTTKPIAVSVRTSIVGGSVGGVPFVAIWGKGGGMRRCGLGEWVPLGCRANRAKY